MKFIIKWSKEIIIPILILVFIIGILIGGKWGNSLDVFSERLVPIYSVNRDDKKIAITLDGTWGADNTEKLLNIFEKEDINVTFFFAGYWLEKYPDLVKKIATCGHEIENHSFTHPHFTKISKNKMKEELTKTSNLIYETIGKKPKYFRPPFGDYNNSVIETVRSEGYEVVQWTLDSHDWQEPGVDYIVNRILENLSAGDIILMHNNAPDTPEALKILIPKLKEKKYEIVPLSELIYDSNYIIHPHNGVQERRG
ncbi:MAG: polysaccharide deacetylase family protein [Bacillota bacterium]